VGSHKQVETSKLLNDLRRDGLITVDFASKAPRPFVLVTTEPDEQAVEEDA
jgi:hypothetical protein